LGQAGAGWAHRPQAGEQQKKRGKDSVNGFHQSDGNWYVSSHPISHKPPWFQAFKTKLQEGCWTENLIHHYYDILNINNYLNNISSS
jgi:hypothetical protein